MKTKYWLNLLWVVFLVVVIITPLTITTPTYASTQTETLYPNAAGDYTNIPTQYPASGSHWEKVDDVVYDEDATYVKDDATGSAYKDAYNLTATSIPTDASITSVTVYFRFRVDYQMFSIEGKARPYLRLGASETTGAWVTKNAFYGGHIYSTHSETLSRPGGGSWAVADLDSLQVAIELQGATYYPYGATAASCTQVYVVVSYLAPTVATGAATSIAETTATLNGNVTAIEDTSITERGFVWDTSSHLKPNTAPSSSEYDYYWTEAGAFSTGAYSHGATTLTKDTLYYVRACAENDDGIWGYGDEVTFTTYAAPIGDTDAASNIASTSARLNSTIADDGTGTCQVRWGYGETSEAAIEDYDLYTEWEGAYTTGQHPYYDASSLSVVTLYYFRVEIKNSYSTVLGNEESFTTSSGVSDPTDLKAVPSGNNISLSWVKGAGSTESVLRYRMDTYPASYTDGTLVYQGTSSSYSHTGLTPGTTYYYAIWGKSGVLYSSGSAEVLATTSGAPAPGGSLEGPVEPGGWLSAVDYTNLAGLPIIYDVMNAVADAISMPRGNWWLIIWVAVSVGIAFGIYKGARDSALAGLFSLSILLAFGSAAIKVPVWMPVCTFISCISIFFFRRREAQ